MANKKKTCKDAKNKFTNIDLFSKRIELTYEGHMYNDTMFGACTTVLLVICMLSVGLQGFIQVTEKKISLVNRDVSWLDIDNE